MKLFKSSDIREWDKYTILNEPILSIDLMERAASACADYILKSFNSKNRTIKIFCGLGNNGGDGIAIARILKTKGLNVHAYIVCYSDKKSVDFASNEKKFMEHYKSDLTYLYLDSELPKIEVDDIIIDAIFGTGFNRMLEGITAKIISHINLFAKTVLAIDVPSGLPSEIFDATELQNRIIINATHTLTLQVPKLCFMHPETYEFVSDFSVIDIGLSKAFADNLKTDTFYLSSDFVKSLIHQRAKFSHKGNFGHALLAGGSYGKMGSITLTAKAALRTGCGLVTTFIPKTGYTVLQTSLPESMVITDESMFEISEFPNFEKYNAVGIGPGMGTAEQTMKALENCLRNLETSLLLDADAINLVAIILRNNPEFKLPESSILTPHPKEFDRIAGMAVNSFERLHNQKHFSEKHNCYVVLKGAHTSISCPDGTVYFNSIANPALATAGSGDVLSGIITSLLAQGYEALEASLVGVHLHTICANLWTSKKRKTMIASDIIEMIPEALFEVSE